MQLWMMMRESCWVMRVMRKSEPSVPFVFLCYLSVFSQSFYVRMAGGKLGKWALDLDNTVSLNVSCATHQSV